MDEEKIKYEYIRSMKTAALLMLKGFRLLEIQPSKKNPYFDVYCFRQTPELTNALFEIIEQQNGGNKNGINNENCKDKTFKKSAKTL